jgi:site-specific recombinase XerC
LGINERSSTLLTRYSIANHLKQLGASTEVIKDLLGHSSVYTTEIYLISFEVNVNGGYIKQLLDKHMGFSSSKQVTDVEVVSDSVNNRHMVVLAKCLIKLLISFESIR